MHGILEELKICLGSEAKWNRTHLHSSQEELKNHPNYGDNVFKSIKHEGGIPGRAATLDDGERLDDGLWVSIVDDGVEGASQLSFFKSDNSCTGVAETRERGYLQEHAKVGWLV